MRLFRGAATALVLAVAIMMLTGLSQAAKREVTFFYNWYGSDGFDDLSLKLVDEFEAAHPDIDVKLVRGGTVNGQSPTDRLVALIAAGTPPDVVHFERSIVTEWAAKGLLLPLEHYLPSIEEKFIPGAMQEVLYKGSVYGVPWGTDIRGLFWNKADFEASGFDAEQGPATMSDLDSMAAKLTRPDGEGGFSKVGFVPWIGNWYAVGWLYTFGGDIFDAEKIRPRVNTPNHIRGFDWIQEYGQRYPYDVVGAALKGKSYTTFYDRSVSMMAHWNGFGNLVKKADPNLEFWAGELPHPAYGTNGTWLGGQAYVVPKASKNPDDAVTLLKWLTRKEVEVELYRVGTRIPTRWSALAEIQDDLTPTDAILLKQSDVAWGRPPLWYPPFYTKTAEAMRKVARLEASPKDALDEAQRLLEIDFKEILGE